MMIFTLIVQATSADLRTWRDRGPAFCTSDVCPPAPDPAACNAIDPHAFNSGGRSWMVFGSFWSGIALGCRSLCISLGG